MKKNFFLLSFVASCLVATLTACSSTSDIYPDVVSTESTTTAPRRTLTITVGTHGTPLDTATAIPQTRSLGWEGAFDEVATRTVLTPASDGKTLTATWKADDEAYLVTTTNNFATFTAKETAKNTRFSGEVTCNKDEGFTLFYPNINNTTVTKQSASKLSLNIATQDGTIEGIADKLDFTLVKGVVNRISADGTLADGTVNTSENLLTTLRLRFKDAQNNDITDITSLELMGVNTTATLDLTDTEGLQILGNNNGKITLSNLGNGQGVQDIYVALLPGQSKITFKAKRKSAPALELGGVFANANYSSAGKYIRATTRLYGYVQVGETKWAMGNLYFDGLLFHVADRQYYLVQDWDHPQSSNNVNSNRKDQTNEVDLFYYSPLLNDKGIYSSSNADVVTTNYGDLSGYLYSSQQKADPTTVWRANARWGDIAFWATKGTYRLPTRTEMEALIAKPHQYCYVEGEGKKCYGMIFDLTNEHKYFSENLFDWRNPPHYTLDQVQTGELLFLPVGGYRNKTKVRGKNAYTPSDQYYLNYQTSTGSATPNSSILYGNGAKLEISSRAMTEGTNVRPVLNF